MNQKHLVPQVVIDCAEKMLDEHTNHHVKQNFRERLEAIKQFCEIALNQKPQKKRG